MLIPLLAPSPTGASLGFGKIAKALGVAGLKAVVAIVTIITGGRLLLRPLYRRIAEMENAEIFAATTLLVVLGTSVMTQIAGLSLALGAFLVSATASVASCHTQCWLVLPTSVMTQLAGLSLALRATLGQCYCFYCTDCWPGPDSWGFLVRVCVCV